MRSIDRSSPGADVAFVELDQGDLGSVRRCAHTIIETEDRLDVLVNNAGIMVPPRELTKDGFESQFGVNHLGTFALTGLLLDKLADAEAGRVVITSSLAHHGGTIHFDDLAAEDGYERQGRYQQSKLANILHMAELDRRLRAAESSVIAVGCHPGIANTDLGRHLTWLKFATPLISPFFNTAAQGAWPTLQAAISPDVQGGDYYGPSKRREMAGPSAEAKMSRQARDPELAGRLWDVSVALTGIDPGI
jgi:NAD(P)-dependent dehydrogenase (short-subunit alcohol dehydrogenase family)